MQPTVHMSYLNPTIALLLAAFSAFSARAQECPPSIELKHVLQQGHPGWGASRASTTHALVGMQVIAGSLHADPGDDAELKPESDSAGHGWTFRSAIGDQEVWMRCNYRDTSVRLDRRVEKTATECKVEKSEPRHGATALVRAYCQSAKSS